MSAVLPCCSFVAASCMVVICCEGGRWGRLVGERPLRSMVNSRPVCFLTASSVVTGRVCKCALECREKGVVSSTGFGNVVSCTTCVGVGFRLLDAVMLNALSFPLCFLLLSLLLEPLVSLDVGCAMCAVSEDGDNDDEDGEGGEGGGGLCSGVCAVCGLGGEVAIAFCALVMTASVCDSGCACA